jgi:hypothetical protein
LGERAPEPCLLTHAGWFRRKDSNLRSRIQSPLPYQLGHGGLSLNTLARSASAVDSDRVTSGRAAALGLVMRNVLLAALVLVTTACGAYRFPGSTTAGTGTVSGAVVSVPCSPVEQADQQCAGRPVTGLEIDFANGEASAKAVTDSTGHYTVTLAPGTWSVHLVTHMRVVSGPAQVAVPSGSTVTATYVLDSGIRVPVPQQ